MDSNSRVLSACASSGITRFTDPQRHLALLAGAAPRLKTTAADFVVREVTLGGVACGSEEDAVERMEASFEEAAAAALRRRRRGERRTT